MESAVGFLRRNLLVPVPEAGSLEELNGTLRARCDRINARSRSSEGAPTPQPFREGLAGTLALPGVPFDAVRWTRAKSDKRGYVRSDGNLYCAGPAWHDRELLVGVRAGTVEILADRGRHVATLRRGFGEGERLRNPPRSYPPSWRARTRSASPPSGRSCRRPGWMPSTAWTRPAGGRRCACSAGPRSHRGSRPPARLLAPGYINHKWSD